MIVVKVKKKCNYCKKIKLLSEFYKNPNTEYYSGYCSICDKIINKKCSKRYLIAHREEMLKRGKTYRSANKNKVAKRARLYYEQNKEKMLHNSKLYLKSHLKERRNYLCSYRAKRYKQDFCFKILHILRTRIWSALKGHTKSASTMKLIGCSIESLKAYLAKQFKPRMTWKNYGKWHVDHIKPCVSFDLSKLSEQLKCFNYTNLQPLWAEENMKKGCKI